MKQLVLVAHNLRSCHNVGSLLRTADGLGVDKIYLTGYTPYPTIANDRRLPHISARLTRQIHKTALGAESSTKWEHVSDISVLINRLRADGFDILALEQDQRSVPLPALKPAQKTAIIVGNEVSGLNAAELDLCDHVTEIPMLGEKESLNVVQATAIALYHCRHSK